MDQLIKLCDKLKSLDIDAVANRYDYTEILDKLRKRIDNLKQSGGNKHNSYLKFKTKDGKTIKKKIYLIKGKEKVRDGMKDNKINFVSLSTYKKKCI